MPLTTNICEACGKQWNSYEYEEFCSVSCKDKYNEKNNMVELLAVLQKIATSLSEINNKLK
jgi:hypothetical protein